MSELIAARLEAAEAANALAFAQSCVGIVAEPVAGGCAMFAGVGSMVTHALGVGMNGPVSVEEFDRLEHFFHSRGSASLIDLCPLADLSVIEQVTRRGYKVIEFNNVLARPVRFYEPPPKLPARLIRPGEGPVWNRLVAQGFSGMEEPPGEYDQALAQTERCSQCFLSEVDEVPAAGGALGIRGRVALFYGDATLMRYRSRGLQLALIQARLEHASASGCDLAMASVLPGSGSQRNYERAGFSLVYMRVNVMREL
jgi:GNAT superfamily N-acetyltransferase